MSDDDNSPAPEAEPGALEGSEGINVAGLISIIVFYLVVLLIGLWAGWRQRKVAKQQGRSSNDQEEVMLAGRDIGLFVGIMTMGGTYFLDDGAFLTILLNFKNMYGIFILFISLILLSATWVGGGFINGSAQETYKAGLIWTQAPFGYGLSLFISKIQYSSFHSARNTHWLQVHLLQFIYFRRYIFR